MAGGMNMSARLDRQYDLESLAAACSYSVMKMARRLGKSPRQLRRLFHAEFNVTPKQKLDEWRAKKIIDQIRSGDPVKLAAQEVSFKYASHASKFVRRVLHASPRDYRPQGR
jgi:AraC-like DNA-binding protein